MKCWFASVLASMVGISLLAAGCAPAAPPPAPTAAAAKAATAPAKVPEPTAAPAAPTKAAAQPTAMPAPKVDYPAKGKPITFIVSWPPGGTTDVQARALAAALERDLEIQMPVVNKDGASGQVGTTEIVTSKPDGYTMGMTNLPTSMMTYLLPERKAVYGRKDLQQVANQVSDAEGLLVKADSPFKSIKDVVDAAKANPGKVTLATMGIGSDTHLAVLLLQKAAGVKFNIVHFNGASPALTALMGGHVDVASSTVSNSAPHVKSGAGRQLVVMDDVKSRYMPDVPTAKSQGYDVSYMSSRGVSMPAGTPKEIVNIMSSAIKRVTEGDEKLKKMLEDAFLGVRYMDAAEYTAFWDKFEAETKALVESLEFKVQ